MFSGSFYFQFQSFFVSRSRQTAMSKIKNVLAFGVIIFALCNLYFVYIVCNTIMDQKNIFDQRELSERRDLSKEYLKLAVKGTFLVFSVFCSVFLVVGAIGLNRFTLTIGFILLICQILVIFYQTVSRYFTDPELDPVFHSALFLSKF